VRRAPQGQTKEKSRRAPFCASSLVAGTRRKLLDWYRANRRDLPWRISRDPYRIWISEIMLQQTRVAAAIPYYERFLLRFPGVAELASAPEQELLAAWAGLGYYARARNLQRAARKILALGEFPRDYDSIRALDGIGDYTAAAIASIAFDLPHAALDGNAIRVLSRLTAERGNVSSSIVKKRLGEVADRLIDPQRPGEFNQAWMELGAVICVPKEPRCGACPLTKECAARREGLERELPLKVRRAQSKEVEHLILIVQKAEHILAWQRPRDDRRLAGFWELPEAAQLPSARIGARIATVRHTIVNTNYSLRVHRAASAGRVPKGFHWLKLQKLNELPLSTAAKKALKCLAEHESRGN
jgi:A/G-specific adenine glycosylase